MAASALRMTNAFWNAMTFVMARRSCREKS